MTDQHNVKTRLQSLRQKNQYQIVENLDQHLTLKLDNTDNEHHYRHLNNCMKIKDHKPDRNLENLDKDKVADILQEIEQSQYSTKVDNYKTASKNKYRKTLDYLLQMQDLHWDDMTPRGVDKYQSTTDQTKTDKEDLLNPEELNHFLQRIRNNSSKRQALRNEAFFYTLWNTGARVGGVLKTKTEDLEIHNEVVEVTVPQHKDSPRRENLPLYFAAPVLKRYLEAQNQEYLFTNPSGDQISYRAIREKAVQAWKQLEEEDMVDVEWRGQPLHIFRKSFKTYAGIMELLGPDESDIWTGHAIGSTQIKQIYDRRDTGAAGNQMRKALGLEEETGKNWKKKIAPQKCESCGSINSSHRPVCFDCGGVLKREELPGSLDEKDRSKELTEKRLAEEVIQVLQSDEDANMSEIKQRAQNKEDTQ